MIVVTEMSLLCELQGRSFLALLNGISKKAFHGDTTITYDVLVDTLFDKDEDKSQSYSQIRNVEKVKKTQYFTHHKIVNNNYYYYHYYYY